jgi:hypothetical protein
LKACMLRATAKPRPGSASRSFCKAYVRPELGPRRPTSMEQQVRRHRELNQACARPRSQGTTSISSFLWWKMGLERRSRDTNRKRSNPYIYTAPRSAAVKCGPDERFMCPSDSLLVAFFPAMVRSSHLLSRVRPRADGTPASHTLV